MSAANDLIEQAEAEAGCRWDDPNNPTARAKLFGALARATGKSKFGERDDVAVGLLVMDDIANGEQKQRERDLLALALGIGLSPDDIRALGGKR